MSDYESIDESTEIMKAYLGKMSDKQQAWWVRQNATMESITEAWCHDRTLAYSLYTDKFRTDIDTACKRLGIDLARAWDADGWDGEEDADIITTGRQVEAIRMKMAGETIPVYWSESREQAMETSSARRRQ